MYHKNLFLIYLAFIYVCIYLSFNFEYQSQFNTYIRTLAPSCKNVQQEIPKDIFIYISVNYFVI